MRVDSSEVFLLNGSVLARLDCDFDLIGAFGISLNRNFNLAGILTNAVMIRSKADCRAGIGMSLFLLNLASHLGIGCRRLYESSLETGDVLGRFLLVNHTLKETVLLQSSHKLVKHFISVGFIIFTQVSNSLRVEVILPKDDLKLLLNLLHLSCFGSFG